MTRADVNRKLKRMGAAQWELAECMSVHKQTLVNWMSSSVIREDHKDEIERGFSVLTEKIKKERELSDEE